MDELKACCPWCNSELTVTYEEDRVYKAVCTHCGKTITFEDKSRTGAFDTLNRRTHSENKPLTIARIAEIDKLKTKSPIYLVFDNDQHEENRWIELFNWTGRSVDGFGFGNECETTFLLGSYGITWNAYFSKPEQEEK